MINAQNIVSSDDQVNHPSHYTQYRGLEIIDLVEQMNYNRGNAVKYIARAGFKNPDTEVQDLEKAMWYIRREIRRITAQQQLQERHEKSARVHGGVMYVTDNTSGAAQ